MVFIPKEQEVQDFGGGEETDNRDVSEMIEEFQQLYNDIREYMHQDSHMVEQTDDHMEPLDYHGIDVVQDNPFQEAF